MHTGQLLVGNHEVTLEETYRLVIKAGDVLKWIERLLPENRRRPIATELPQVAIALSALLL